MSDLRRLVEEDERRPSAEPAPVPSEPVPTPLAQLMRLQRSAGNAAVARMLAGQLEAADAALAREGADAPAAEQQAGFDPALVALWETSVVAPAKAGARALGELQAPSPPGPDDPDAKLEDAPQRDTFFREWRTARQNIDVVTARLGRKDGALRLRLEVLAATMRRIETDARLIFGAKPSFKWASDACASGHAATVRLARKLRPAGGGDGAPSAHTTAALIKALFKANVSEPMRALKRPLATGGPDAARDAVRVVDRVVEHLAGLYEAYAGDLATRDLMLEIELLITQMLHLRDGLEVLGGGEPPSLEDVQVDADHTAAHDAPSLLGTPTEPSPPVPAAR